MVMIPISVFYFVFGFVTCFALIILLSIYLANKQKREREKSVNEFVKKLSELTKKDEE